MRKEYNEDTISLLKECSAGCKMAIDNFEQISSMIQDQTLKELIKKYNTDHIKLHEECHLILNEAGAEDKEPNMMATMMGKLQSQMKLMSSGDTKKAAEILTDGCNMGMKTLSEFMNQYKNADSRAIMICEKIYQIEDQMMDELRAYL